MPEVMLAIGLSRRRLGAAPVCVWLWIAKKTCWRARKGIRMASSDDAGGVGHGQTQPEAAWCCLLVCLTVD